MLRKINFVRTIVVVSVVFALSGAFFVQNAGAVGVSVTPMTGGINISIDTTSAGGTGAYTFLGGPIITESNPGEIGLGLHILTLPVGWEFNTIQNVTIGIGGTTDLSLSAQVVTPLANSLSFNVTQVSTIGAATLTFSDFQVRPAATIAPVSVNVTHSGASILGVVNGVTNFGTISAVPGVATQIRVETASNGSGVVVPAQSITADDDLTVYSVRRDQFENFIDNPSSTWSLESELMGVDEADLVGGGASAVFTGHLVGSALIHVVNGVLTSVDSGVITVTPGVAATVTIAHQPASVGTVDVVLTDPPIAHVVDADGNNVSDGTSVTALKVSGTGTLFGTTTETTINGNATFDGLRYDRLDAFTIKFTSNGHDSDESSPVTLTAGAPTVIRVETTADGSGIIVPADTITADEFFTVYSITRDQFGNFVDNTAATWSLPTKTEGVADGDLAPAVDNKSATFSGNLVGTAVIRAVIGGLTSADSGLITVEHGALVSITVSPDTANITADQTQAFTAAGFDTDGNTWDVTAGTTFSIVGGGDGGSFTGAVYSPHTVGVYQVNGVNGLFSDDTASLEVTPGIVATVTIANLPVSGTTVDDPLNSVIVHVEDAHENNVIALTSVVVSQVSGSGTLSGTFFATTVGPTGDATFSDLHYNRLDAFTIKFTSNGHDSSVSNAITLTAGAPTDVSVETMVDGTGVIVPSQTITADQSKLVYSITRDQFGNFVDNAAATWSLAITTGGVLGTDLTAALDNKSATFNGNVIGTATIRAVIGGLISHDSGTITVEHGVLASIIISPDVESITADETQTFSAAGFDSSLNTWDVTADTTFSINEAPVDGGSFTGAIYSPHTVGVYTVHGVNGIFTDDSTSLTVTPGVATHLIISEITDPVVAGVASDVTVTAKDQFNNTAMGYTGTVHFTSSDVGSLTVLPVNYQFLVADAGVKTLVGAVTLTTAGEQTVTGTDILIGSITGQQVDITVTNAAIYRLRISALPLSQTVNLNSNLTITGKDFYDNTVLVGDGNNHRVHLTIDNGGQLANAGLTLSAGVNATTVTNTNPGATRVSVIDLSNTSILDDEVVITFNAVGAPVITAINATPSQTGAVINFTSDRVGKSRIDFGTTDSYGFSTQYPASNNMTADAANNITLGGLNCGTLYHYKVSAKSTSEVEIVSPDQAFTTTACPSPVIPTVVLNGSAIISAYSETDANTRFATGVQFTVTNDASVTVNGGTVSSVAGVITAATNAEATTLGAHVYHVVVTSSTGNIAEITMGYQVNADDVVPVLPTISLVGTPIVSTYVFTDADVRFATGLQLNVTNDATVTVNGSSVTSVAGVVTAATNAEAKTLGAHVYHIVVTSSTGHTAELTVGYQVNADLAIPDITAPDVPVIMTSSATIDADTYVVAGTVADDGGSRTVRVFNGVTLAGSAVVPAGQTSWALVVLLTQNAANVFTATAADEEGNTSVASLLSVTITEATAIGDTDDPATPMITTTATTVDANTYTVTGTSGADLPSDGVRIITVLRNGTVVGSLSLPSSETDWSFVAPLLQNTANSFTATSTDAAGNESVVSNTVVITEATTADITPPVISSIHPTSITETSININWQTDEASDSIVQYGLTSEYTNSSSSGSDVTSHTRALTGLLPGTTYHYRVRSEDAFGNQATSDDFVFTTASPAPPAVVSGVTNTTAIKTFAIADDTYGNGWEWVFDVTLPDSESSVSVKFDNWVSGGNTIAAANNIRYFSAQSSDANSEGTAITLSAPGVYAGPMTVVTDNNLAVAGRQIQIHVQVKVPAGTAGGSYSTSYGIKSTTP